MVRFFYIFVILTFMGIGRVYAVDTSIGGSVQFLPSLVLSKTDLSFGIIEFSPAAGAASISLSSQDGSLVCSSSEYSCASSAQRGELNITGDSGLIVDISCESEGTLSNGTDSISFEQTELFVGGSTASCTGVDTVSASLSLQNDPQNDMAYLGGVLVIPPSGITVASSFDTVQAGGDPIAIRVIYQ